MHWYTYALHGQTHTCIFRGSGGGARDGLLAQRLLPVDSQSCCLAAHGWSEQPPSSPAVGASVSAPQTGHINNALSHSLAFINVGNGGPSKSGTSETAPMKIEGSRERLLVQCCCQIAGNVCIETLIVYQ